MSWQLGALAILGLALGAGFAWYERARPDARIVALVATLAAFGALGRIAFAAVPNVKPTTDIVLIAGYALGGGPGFAVGALAGLASNFFFGQGPWTPWQMAAWGATGVIGAGLARLGTIRRAGNSARIGRLPLAAVCGVVGFGFTVVQDVGDWVAYSDHSAGQLGAYVGQGLGFDAVHAAGCVGFALLLGPGLIGALERFTRRLQVRWVAPGTAFALLAIAAAGSAPGLPGLPGPAAARAAPVPGSPVGYLLAAQNADGGFGAARGQPSSSVYSGWAALGLASANVEPLRVMHGGPSVIGYIEAHPARDTGSLERTILVLRAAGLSARRVAGHDLVAMLERRRGAGGAFGGLVNLTAFGVLALRAAGVPVPAASVRWLIGQQGRDGGYGFAGVGSMSDTDDTGAVLEALAGQPGAAAARRRAVAYLRAHQDHDGGFAAQPGQGSNAQSTAWAVQGLAAVGLNPAAVHRGGGPSPLDYLRSLIGANGAVAYARGQNQTPVWVTGEALMALQERPLPLLSMTLPHPAPRPARRLARGWLRPAARAEGPVRAEAALQRRILRLAAGAGLATAVLLAPLGVG